MKKQLLLIAFLSIGFITPTSPMNPNLTANVKDFIKQRGEVETELAAPGITQERKDFLLQKLKTALDLAVADDSRFAAQYQTIEYYRAGQLGQSPVPQGTQYAGGRADS